MNFKPKISLSLSIAKNFNSSPITCAQSTNDYEDQISIQEYVLLEEQHTPNHQINNKATIKTAGKNRCHHAKQNYFSQVETQIMSYFREKGVEPGHPEDMKKQYNKKLHKRVSVLSEVNQVVMQKVSNGSSLLQRRLQKKMSITV